MRYLKISLYNKIKDLSSNKANNTLRKSSVINIWVYNKSETNIYKIYKNIYKYLIYKKYRES